MATNLSTKQIALAKQGTTSASELVRVLYAARTWAERCLAAGITFDSTTIQATPELQHLEGADLETYRTVITWLWVQLEANAATSKKQLEKLLRD